ncbi:MAG: gamma-butyrobetaine hydroxylase-like domain-containing protein [Minwuia sp.]|uniref:gamma-butyrobetaine hydroxylase-like domain-containing protein n=1 Tax=Minwuia sp. TaxID=2493630 RepID=UPI003A85826A
MAYDVYEEAGRPQPLEIRLKQADRLLEVDFENGRNFSFTHEFLRVESPSAEVKGHGPSQRQWVPGKINVQITEIEPVGNYAVRLKFDDGHNTGIYSWSYLYEAGDRYEEIWERYCDELDSRGLSRGS